METWTDISWWEGKRESNFEACGQCRGDDSYVWNRDNPELCLCERTSDSNTVRTTARFLRTLRRLKWEEDNDWDEEDWDRIVDSNEVNVEDLQDFEREMVIVGYDIVSLYPNSDISQIVKRIEEAVKMSNLK